MENINYANIANNLLGDELYCKFIKQISKDYKKGNIVDFGKKVVNSCCFLLIMIGMSKKVKIDNVKICLEDEIVEISCKEFAMKYEHYIKQIENNMFQAVKSMT